MEKTDRETHDFMNVESFSQLPFIRPSSSSSQKEKGIRLFGKEFGGHGDSNTMIIDEDLDTNDNNTTTAATQEELSLKELSNNESSRKFECHYCCRNFPTSQALGGHQNAHKRERQHAKRAHLQSTMVNGSFSDAQMYGLMNYHRFTNNHSSTTLPPPYYHPNPTITNYNHRFNYGNTPTNYNNTTNSSHHQLSSPINGNPLGLWRYPNAQNMTFNRDHSFNTSQLLSSGDHLGLRGNSRIATSSGYMYDSKPSVQDQVSLDLHL